MERMERTNETRISVNPHNKTATIKGDNFDADVTPDYCLIDLGNQTFKVDSKFFRLMYLTFEIADQMEDL